MLKNSLIILLATTLFSCTNQDDTQSKNLKQDAPFKTVGAINTDATQLKFQNFQDSKWIIGEVGVNGEQPDTIIFTKPDTLTYISTDTGRELCRYSFDNDTLVFFSHSVEADISSFDDLTCESVNKLHYENETFKYAYLDKKCTGDKAARRFRMDTLDVRFRRL